MSSLLPVLVLLPLAAAGVTALLPERARFAVTLAAVLGVGTGVVLVAGQVAADGPVELALAGWGPPLGILLRADAASAVMLGLTAVLALAVTCYAAGHEKVRGGTAFWPLWLAVIAALNGVFVSGDLFNLYVMLELLTIAAVSLVALGGRSAAAPALRYLFVAVVGSLLFLLAVALVYGETGALDIAIAADRMTDSALLPAVLGLTTVGMAAKLALFPLHSWLPVAHPAAPAAVSAVLSALVIKASLFVLWRVFFDLAAGSAAAEQLGLGLGVVGGVAVLWGAFMGLRRTRLKQIIAYSTVSQVGYLVLVFALAQPAGGGDGAVVGWTGGVAFAVSHGIAKAAMFMAAGTLALAYGSDRLIELRGAVTTMPLSVATLAVAGVSLAGLPPTFGFVPKWQLLEASIESGQWWWIVPLLLGGLMAFAYTAAMVRATFNKPGDDSIPGLIEPVSRTLSITPFALALLALVLGFAPAPLLEFIAGGFPGGIAS